MRHMFALDANQAAEHVEFATLALALQPYKAQVSFLHYHMVVNVPVRLQYMTHRHTQLPIQTIQSSRMLCSTDLSAVCEGRALRKRYQPKDVQCFGYSITAALCFRGLITAQVHVTA